MFTCFLLFIIVLLEPFSPGLFLFSFSPGLVVRLILQVHGLMRLPYIFYSLIKS